MSLLAGSCLTAMQKTSLLASSMTEQDTHWHLDKRLNVTHLFTTLTLLAAAFWWVNKTETRLAIVETTIGHEVYQIQEIRQDVKDIKKYLLNGARKS